MTNDGDGESKPAGNDATMDLRDAGGGRGVGGVFRSIDDARGRRSRTG